MILRQQISIHDDEVAGASAHDEQVEDLMTAEVLVSAVEQRKLQRVDHAADGVDDPACKQPSESGRGEIAEQLGECQHTGPSHADVKHGRYPFRAEDPEGLDQDTGDGDAPHDGEQYDAEPPLKTGV